MRKKSRQKAIFSSLAGFGLEPFPPEPIAAEVPGKAGPEEVLPPPGLKPPAPERLVSKPIKAEVPEAVTPPPLAAVKPSPSEPVPSRPDLAAIAKPEEVLTPAGPKPPVPEREVLQPPEAELAQFETSAAASPPAPETGSVPTAESPLPPAAAEPAHIPPQALDVETPLISPAEPEPLPEELPSQFFSSVKLAPETLDFGRVLVGDFADRDVAVANEGNGPGVLTGLRGLSGTGFSLIALPRLPLTLAPGGSQSYTVRFSPDSPGRKTAGLSVALDGQDGPGPKLQLTGVAIRTITTSQGLYFSPLFNSLDMSFVYIPPGSFVMGSPESELGRNQDEQQHEVTLSRGFYLQSTPVTQRQWQAMMGGQPASSPAGSDYPVEQVSWQECQVFLQKLNLLGEGAYRLPTEAEWEYACRAGGAAALGDQELTVLICEYDPMLDELAWYCGNSDRHSHPVALKSPNAWGLYDMHGNVMEWCQDWYGDYPAGAATDPAGPPAGTGKVIRGGSWFSSAKNCRAAFRAKWAPNSRSHYLGLRLLKELE